MGYLIKNFLLSIILSMNLVGAGFDVTFSLVVSRIRSDSVDDLCAHRAKKIYEFGYYVSSNGFFLIGLF